MGKNLNGGLHGQRPDLNLTGKHKDLTYGTDFRGIYSEVLDRVQADSETILGERFSRCPSSAEGPPPPRRFSSFPLLIDRLRHECGPEFGCRGTGFAHNAYHHQSTLVAEAFSNLAISLEKLKKVLYTKHRKKCINRFSKLLLRFVRSKLYCRVEQPGSSSGS